MSYPYLQDSDIKALAAIQLSKLAALTTGGVPFADASGFIAVDAATLFWNNTTKKLSIGAGTQTKAKLWIKAAADNYDEFLYMQGTGASDFWGFYVSPGGHFYIRNGNSTVTPMEILNGAAPTIGFLNASASAGKGILVKPYTTTDITLALAKLTAQTGEFLVGFDTDGTTKLFNVTIAGKGIFSNIQDTAFAAIGVVTNDASGNFSTVAPSTNGNVLTSNGTSWVSSAAAGSAALSVVTKTADYVVTNSDDIILCNPAAANMTITFQTSASATKKRYTIKNISPNGGVSVVPNAADTIENDSVVFLPAGGTPMPGNEFIPDGVNTWYVSA